jgi:hypothetical protein
MECVVHYLHTSCSHAQHPPHCSFTLDIVPRFPWDYKYFPWNDGIMLVPESMPGIKKDFKWVADSRRAAAELTRVSRGVVTGANGARRNEPA